MALAVKAAVRTDAGRSRNNNEDNFYLDGTFLKKEEMDAGGAFAVDASTACALFAVCDGMGGEEKGEEASLAAVRELDKLRDTLGEGKTADVRALIDRCCKRANDAVYAIDGGGHAGTTFVGLCFYEDEAYCANLGDSRLYVLRDGALRRISGDHTEAARLVHGGVLSEEEARGSVYGHIVTHYLGMPPSDEPFHAMHYTDFELHYADRFLLCSDGLTDMLDDEEIFRLLSARRGVNEAVAALVDAALARGGRDNVTALVAEVEREQSANPEPPTEQLFGEEPPLGPSTPSLLPDGALAKDDRTGADAPAGLPLSFADGAALEVPALAFGATGLMPDAADLQQQPAMRQTDATQPGTEPDPDQAQGADQAQSPDQAQGADEARDADEAQGASQAQGADPTQGQDAAVDVETSAKKPGAQANNPYSPSPAEKADGAGLAQDPDTDDAPPAGVKLLFDDDSTTLALEEPGCAGAFAPQDAPRGADEGSGLLETELVREPFVIVERLQPPDDGRGLLEQELAAQSGLTLRDARAVPAGEKATDPEGEQRSGGD